ncbi:MAG: type II secretion system protein [Pseudomonadota bacterium]
MPAHRPTHRAVTGYTMIELVLVIVIIGIMGGVGAQVFSSGLTAYTTTAASLDELNQLRFGMERIARELREIRYTAGAAQIVTPFSATQITFTNNDGNVVTLTTSIPNITLAYTTPAASATLLRNITALSLAYKQNDGATAATATNNLGFVDITVSAQVASGVYTRSTRVAMRSL